MNILALVLALVLVGIARVVAVLFPAPPRKHYDGDFGEGADVLKSWDELSDAERDALWDI